MRYKVFVILLIMLIAFGNLIAAEGDRLDKLPVPQFAGAYYAAFARNYQGVRAAGRGYTGMAYSGGAQEGLLNPAVMHTDSVHIFIETDIKPSIEAPDMLFASRYHSGFPFGIAGVVFPVSERFTTAALYSNPQSIRLVDYSIITNQGLDIEEFKPSYSLHQFSSLNSYALNREWSLGLGLSYQYHHFEESLFLGDFHRDTDSFHLLRVQPGLLYQKGDLGFGLSGKLPVNSKWDFGHELYEFTHPLELDLGLSKAFGDKRLNLELGFKNYGIQTDEFKDEYSLRLGGERKVENTTYRLGYMYKSGVWSGELVLPRHSNPPEHAWEWEWQESIKVLSDTQHYLSLGLQYDFNQGSFAVSILQAFADEVLTTHLQMGIDVNLNIFTKKREIKI